MDIKNQFNLIAEEYDVNRKKFITCFDDFYKSTTEFITSNINQIIKNGERYYDINKRIKRNIILSMC